MTAVMWGADVEALRECAGRFDEGATSVEEVCANVDLALAAVDWVGQDGDEFRTRWTGTMSPRLEAIADALRQSSIDLRRNAEEQTNASTTGGITGGPVTLTAGFGELAHGMAMPSGDTGQTPPDVDPGTCGTGHPSDRWNGNYAPGSFAERMYGEEPQVDDRVLANLASLAYPDGQSTPEEMEWLQQRNERLGLPTPEMPEGWSRVSDDELRAASLDPNTFSDGEGGFDAALFKDENGNYVLAFAGTDQSREYFDTNIPQGAGFSTAQYARALALAKELQCQYGDNLVITGHSLGGGLASHAAVGTGTPAVTFNAAGLHPNSVERAGVDPNAGLQMAENGLIRAYSTENDILTHLQEQNPVSGPLMQDSAGHRIVLGDPVAPDQKPNWFSQSKENVTHRLQMHDIPSILGAMDKVPPWKR